MAQPVSWFDAPRKPRAESQFSWVAPLPVTPHPYLDDSGRGSAADQLDSRNTGYAFTTLDGPGTTAEDRPDSDTTTDDSSPHDFVADNDSPLDIAMDGSSVLDTAGGDVSVLDAATGYGPGFDTITEDGAAFDTVPEEAVEKADAPTDDEQASDEASSTSDPALQSMDELSAFLAELRASQANGPRLSVEPYSAPDLTEQATPELVEKTPQKSQKCEESENTQAPTDAEDSESWELSEKVDFFVDSLPSDSPLDRDDQAAELRLAADLLEVPGVPPRPDTEDPHDTADPLAPADPLDTLNPSDVADLSDAVDSSAVEAPADPDNAHPDHSEDSPPEEDRHEDAQHEDDHREDDKKAINHAELDKFDDLQPETDQASDDQAGDDQAGDDQAGDDQADDDQADDDQADDDQADDDQADDKQAGDEQAEQDQVDRDQADGQAMDHPAEYDQVEYDRADDDWHDDGQPESAEPGSSEQDARTGSQTADTGAHASTADPEQVLAAYQWRFDGETLREVIDDPAGLRSVRERLTRKLTAADNDGARARLLSLRAVVSRVLGDLDEALADGREALAYARSTGELRRTAIAQARLAHVLQWRGEFAEADRLFAQADSVELPDRLRATMHEHAGRCSYDQGRYLEACHHLERAMELRRVEDLTLIARIETTLDAIAARVRRDGWGPYPRSREEIMQLHRPPVPSFDENFRRWGYADEHGTIVMPPRYAEAQPFHEGVAWVRLPAARAWELIDEAGTVLLGVAAGYRRVGAFSEGLAWVSQNDAGGWFAIDRWGWIVVPGGFDDVHPFRRDLAAVCRGGWGAVDRRGRVVVAPRYRGFATELADGTGIDGFTDEGLAVIDAGDRKGVVDRHGRLLVAPVHAQLVIHPVAFLIGDRGGRWGALDRRGELLIDVGYADRGEVLDEIDRLLADTRPVL